MDSFFKVQSLEAVLSRASDFQPVAEETVPLSDAIGRVLSADIAAEEDVPGFPRSTMDGFAVKGASTFGASEGNPAFLTVVGAVAMGDTPGMTVARGQAVRIATGGMLPDGADSVVMIEHTEALDESTIEVYKSVAPGQHVIQKGEDITTGDTLIRKGRRIRPQEAGFLAALGFGDIPVYRKPRIAIISTGDEVVPVDHRPGPGQIRDTNTTTLSGLCILAGAKPFVFGIVRDDVELLFRTCLEAVETCDAVLISGGSSVGTRDYTLEVLRRLPEAQILVHGVSISPGKPTILSRSGNRMIWGLPGHVTSAMIVFVALVRPFIARIGGLDHHSPNQRRISATLSRNLPSSQGRSDFVRVRLIERDGILCADPVLGKSGLLNTMVMADGLVRIDANSEGLDAGTVVEIIGL
ncbi:MAG: molybdopterin molybdotransferase MoeA [Desulfobacterales bacterium]|jgi:molybdopterin molybdotransferase